MKMNDLETKIVLIKKHERARALLDASQCVHNFIMKTEDTETIKDLQVLYLEILNLLEK